MREYFDQMFKTKFSKQIMNNELGFQWVIEEMENEFEYPASDVITFDDFFSKLAYYNQHIEYFIRIYKIDKSPLNINNEFLNLLNNIAKFAYKKISIKDILKKNIENLLNKLTIKEKSKIIKIYNKNLSETKIGYNKKNLTGLKKYKEFFSEFGIKRNQFCTWQEDYIYKMINIRISISEIIPLFSSRYGKFPDYDLWNEKIIQNMKEFFQNDVNAITILEIIDYRLHSKMLSVNTQKIVLKQCLKIIKYSQKIKDFDSVWFNILIKCLKDKKNFIKDNSRCIFVELKRKRNIQIILFLKENSFPIDKELQNKIDKFNIKQIKQIEKIEEINIFNEFIKEEYVLNNINLKMTENIRKFFLKLIKKFENDMVVSICFYNIINFFVEAKKKVNGEIVDKYIFEILKLWDEEYYEKMYSLLKVRTYTTSIETEKIKAFNQVYLQIPEKILIDSFSWSENYILDKMTIISEHALSAMIKPNTIYIDEFLPYYRKINIDNKDSLEHIICEFLDNMQIKYEEQLLNSNMKPKEYLYSIYDDYRHSLTQFVSLLNNDVYKIMYNYIVESFTKYTLIEYPEEIKIAHITQLIPLLEFLIRELGIKNKILPFKEKSKQVHIMKDSSTILLSIIKNNYKKNKNFKNVEVYMFLYNYLYNVNSLNLRNELIHAREYLENESQMQFAFRVLIIGIFWALLELYS